MPDAVTPPVAALPGEPTYDELCEAIRGFMFWQSGRLSHVTIGRARAEKLFAMAQRLAPSAPRAETETAELRALAQQRYTEACEAAAKIADELLFAHDSDDHYVYRENVGDVLRAAESTRGRDNNTNQKQKP